MQIPILIEPGVGNDYRSRGGEPFALSAEGATREEVVAKLRDQFDARLRAGSEVVTLDVPAELPDGPAASPSPSLRPGPPARGRRIIGRRSASGSAPPPSNYRPSKRKGTRAEWPPKPFAEDVD
jgi:hypothetical protein